MFGLAENLQKPLLFSGLRKHYCHTEPEREVLDLILFGDLLSL